MKRNSQNKILIFITSDKHFSKLRKIAKGIPQKIITILGPETDIKNITPEIKEKAVLKTFDEYETPDHGPIECAREALHLIKKWGNLKVNEEKKFEDLTGLKTFFLWKICDNSMMNYYLADLIYVIKIINSILNEEKPSRIILIGSKFDSHAAVFFEIAKQNQIEVTWGITDRTIRISLPVFTTFSERSFFFKKLEIRLYFPLEPYILALFLNNIIKGFWGRIYNLRIKKEDSKKFRNILFYSNNKKQLDSVIPLVRELQKDSKNRVLDIDWFWKSEDAIDSLKKEKVPHGVFDGYLTWKINKTIWKKSKYFLNNWRLIEKNIPFQRSFKFEEFFVWNLVSGYLRKLFLRHFVRMSIFFDIAEEIVSVEKPGIIVVTNEREYIARLCILAGRFKGIPSLELQRGAFDDGEPEREGPLYTDKMIVDGEFGKQALVKRGIESDKLIVAGNPRYDSVIERKNHFSRERICRKLSIESDKKIIVLTTTFISYCEKLNEKRKLLRGIFAAMKNFSDCHLVVKIHPSELNDKVQQSIKQEIKIKNISIIKDIDLWELIYACDLFITSNSTTGSEAILMDKSLIFINLSRIQPDMAPYARSGAAIGVYNEKDFEGAIRDALNDEIINKKLEINRKKFIKQHFFRVDGRATARAADIIIEMIEQRRK